jgi:Helicase conserved C-terminal domain
VPFCGVRPAGPDLSGVRTIAGDYHEGDLSEACDTAKLIANIVTTWQQRGENRPTLLFAIDRKHAKHLEERFTEAGVACEYVDGEVPMFERQDMFERFRRGETKIISSVGTMDTGGRDRVIEAGRLAAIGRRRPAARAIFYFGGKYIYHATPPLPPPSNLRRARGAGM